jgi:hypothetical protein
MRVIEPKDEPLACGTRVYVKSLDVFASVLLWIGQPRTYLVECEYPLLGHIHQDEPARLYLP